MNKVLLIITGSIAASKCKDILKSLHDEEIEITCILTNEGKKYIRISELRNYTENRIFTDESENQNKMLHINLSRNSDIILVCPATANSIAKLAIGLGNNLASNTLLASNKKIILVPAMNSQMWLNKSNQKNIRTLKKRGFEFIGPEEGNLKCGEYGIGRLSKTETIIKKLKPHLQRLNLFKNKRCLVTAGPTLEMIDPIRYISNKSSGKQGYEIASQLSINGAEVILISGPTNIDPPANVKFIKIQTARQMYNEINKISNIDFGFFAAAVSDFKNRVVNNKKIKKQNFLNLDLVKNIDILHNIGNSKKKRPRVLIGFAAETGNKQSAKLKLKNKNCDIIVYNKITKDNKVFGSNTNKISIITKDNVKDFKKMTKINCAKEIIKHVYNFSISK